MAMPGEIKQREYEKFVQSPTRPNGSAIEVVDSGNAFGVPVDCDFIQRVVAGPVETFYFKQGGVSGSILKTVVITYSDSTLKNLLTVEVT